MDFWFLKLKARQGGPGEVSHKPEIGGVNEPAAIMGNHEAKMGGFVPLSAAIMDNQEAKMGKFAHSSHKSEMGGVIQQ